MATSLLKARPRLLMLRAHQLRYQCCRTFSSQNKSSSENKEVKEIPKCTKPRKGTDRWLNIRAGIFGPDDKRLSLPGDVGMNHDISGSHSIISTANLDIFIQGRTLYKTPPNTIDTATYRRLDMAPSDLDTIVENKELELFVDSLGMEVSSNLVKRRKDLECRVQPCPKLLFRDILDLFPQIKFKPDDVTVLTICQKTDNDMSGWSEKVETEREQLIEVFVNLADKLCQSLTKQGFWADFIDPTSGRPYIGPYTNSTLFETDERYRHFGFRIEDLGCCKVLTHKKWGANIFVGALFTNVPSHSAVLVELLHNFDMLATSKS